MSDLFNSQASAPQGEENNEQVQTQTYDHLLQGLKNSEGNQKYATMEQAFEAFQSAQDHIVKLEKEAAEMKAKATETKTMEDILAALQSQGQQEAPPSVPAQEIDIDSRIAEVLAVQEKQKLEKANGDLVVTKVQEAFGENAGEVYYSKAEALGLNKQAIDSLARTSPEAVFSMLGIKEGAPTSEFKPKGINTESFQHTEETLVPKGMYGTKAEQKAEWEYVKKMTAQKLGLN